mgnify:CR=1 FL=1
MQKISDFLVDFDFYFSFLSFFSSKQKFPPFSGEEPVGPRSNGSAILPLNQVLTPYGYQIELPGMRAQAMSLSPDGERLVFSGKTSELVIIDPIDRKILQRLPVPETLLNRILWHSIKGPAAPYPYWAVTIYQDDD